MVRRKIQKKKKKGLEKQNSDFASVTKLTISNQIVDSSSVISKYVAQLLLLLIYFFNFLKIIIFFNIGYFQHR